MAGTATEIGGIVRVSTRRQAVDSDSPANQRHLLTQQGATRFYEYVGSGYKLDQRRRSPAWKALVDDIRSGRLHQLLAVDISRAARKDELLTELIELCDASGVEFLAGGLHVSHGSAMQWYSAKQMALWAELYSRELSDKIRRGQQAALARGVPAVSSTHLPWHLMREPGTKHGVIPHPDRWDDARDAVTAFLDQGASLEILAKRIHARHQLLQHSAAVHKWLSGHAIRGHYGRRNGPVLLFNCFPALISAEEGELVQRRLQQNRKRWGSRSNHEVMALSGLCECLHCGKSLCYYSTKRADGRRDRSSLRCTGERHCPGFRRRINAQLLEESVLYKLNQQALARQAALVSGPKRLPAEVLRLRQRIQTMEQLLGELDSPGVRSDLTQARQRLAVLEQAQGAEANQRVDEAMELLMGGINAFMAQAEAKRNSDLLALVQRVRVDTTCPVVGPLWQGGLAKELLLR